MPPLLPKTLNNLRYWLSADFVTSSLCAVNESQLNQKMKSMWSFYDLCAIVANDYNPAA